MPRLVIFNDPHFSRTEPECRAPTYSKEILDKLHEVAHAAIKIGAKAVACTGDWFHRKGRVTFAETNDLLAVLSSWRERGLDVLGILGNHDISGIGLDSMDTRAAGALYHAKVLQLLDLRPALYPSTEGHLYVTGTSYFHGCDRDDEARVRMYGAPPPDPVPSPPGVDPRPVHVHLAHGALMLNGEFPDEFTSAEQLIPLLHEAGRLPDVIVCGHLHFPEPIRYFDRPDGQGRVAVCRVGSLGRVSRDDLERIPSALVLASRGRDFTLRELPVGKPIEAVEVPAGDPRDPREHEQRIKEFAARLREEAEQVSLEDDAKLLEEIAQRLGHGEQVAHKAMSAVAKRK